MRRAATSSQASEIGASSGCGGNRWAATTSTAGYLPFDVCRGRCHLGVRAVGDHAPVCRADGERAGCPGRRSVSRRLNPGSATMASEFVCSSITSDFPAFFADLVEPHIGPNWDNPHIYYFDGRKHGWIRCTVTPELWRSDYRTVASILDVQAPVTTAASWSSRRASRVRRAPERRDRRRAFGQERTRAAGAVPVPRHCDLPLRGPSVLSRSAGSGLPPPRYVLPPPETTLGGDE